MSQNATLTINPVAGYQGRGREIVVRCVHGQTVAYTGLRQGQDTPSDNALELAAYRHGRIQGCRCTRELLERYSARNTETAR